MKFTYGVTKPGSVAVLGRYYRQSVLCCLLFVWFYQYEQDSAGLYSLMDCVPNLWHYSFSFSVSDL